MNDAARRCGAAYAAAFMTGMQLRALHERDDAARLPASLAPRLRRILSRLLLSRRHIAPNFQK
ncbi:MAG: hypothetical protein OXE57_15795 [Alphaproteobacteria bacterium]|nr:hypothetical protein [Alphaproteobacteria bacterium]